MKVFSLLYLEPLISTAQSTTSVLHKRYSVTYNGFERNGVEVFLNIRYGRDTSGENRFRPPRLYHPIPGSTINAQFLGSACPQEVGRVRGPLALANTTDISEDCLNLNIVRPKSLCNSERRLPVMLFIHGGSFWVGSNGEPTTSPDGLVLESIQNGLPVIHVAINYRLGEQEKSENAGLRDQRLAIEWFAAVFLLPPERCCSHRKLMLHRVRDNIEAFGGDPNRITIYGQSSGGLAVASQILAYGGSQPVPFHQGICESQALGTGLTGNYTRDAVQVLVDYVGCNTTIVDDPETVSCLQSLDMQTLLSASLATFRGDLGDIWLPKVDQDFWPAAPSVLLREGRFANVTTMMGWAQDDLTLYTDPLIQTAQDTFNSVQAAQVGMSVENINRLLALYPVADFSPDTVANLSAEFYRAARISRDILMVCQPMHLASSLATAGNDVFLYDWNQTIVGPALAYVRHQYGIGVPHTAEFAYIFGNLSVYDVNGYPFAPTTADYLLAHRGSRSWSTFASTGKPSLEGHNTFIGFEKAYVGNTSEPYIFVAGGPYEGLSAVDGPISTPEVTSQKLRERCAFINSPEMIDQLRY